MRMWIKAAAIAVGVAMLPGTASAAGIIDGGFEAQGSAITNGNGYCYFSGSYNAPACTPGGAWTGSGATSGLQFETNTAWPGTPSPDGRVYGFIQGYFGQLGSISQTFTVDPGTYALNWLNAGRPGYGGNQSYSVLVDGNLVFSGSTTTGQGFGQQTSNQFVLTGGSHTVKFSALNGTSDNTSFIDGVSIAAVPEPATWAMMIIGFGAIGGMLRTRRRAIKASFA